MIAHKERLKAKSLDEREETIKTLLEDNRRANVSFILAVGRELEAAHKQLSRNGDGAFYGWCRKKLKLGRTTVWKWLRVFRIFGDCPQCKQSFQPSALYLLAKPSTPSSVRKEALRLADRGTRITFTRAKLLLEAEEIENPPPELSKVEDDEDEEPTPTPPKKNKVPPSALDALKSAWKRATWPERQKFRWWVDARLPPMPSPKVLTKLGEPLNWNAFGGQYDIDKDRFVGLLCCAKQKHKEARPARDLYRGSRHIWSVKWLERNCSEWYILSAEHGLLRPDQVVEPYDTYLKDLSDEERRAWAREKVRPGLKKLEKPIVYLGGIDYVNAINDGFKRKIDIVPLFKRLRLGGYMKWASWLKNNPTLGDELIDRLMPARPNANARSQTGWGLWRMKTPKTERA